MSSRAPWRDMTLEELEAWNGLIAGELEPLADHLESESGVLHPVLQRWLVKLIRGSKEETDYRLNVEKHPDLPRLSDGVRFKRLASLETLSTALMVARNGGLDGMWDAAVQTVVEQTGMSRRTVVAHWSQHKSFIRMSRARGILKF